MGTSKITVYGADWCGDCIRTKRFLVNHLIEFEWINIDQDKEGEAFVKKVNNGYRSIPTVIFEDGSILVEPSDSEFRRKLEMLGFSV